MNICINNGYGALPFYSSDQDNGERYRLDLSKYEHSSVTLCSFVDGNNKMAWQIGRKTFLYRFYWETEPILDWRLWLKPGSILAHTANKKILPIHWVTVKTFISFIQTFNRLTIFSIRSGPDQAKEFFQSMKCKIQVSYQMLQSLSPVIFSLRTGDSMEYFLHHKSNDCCC